MCICIHIRVANKCIGSYLFRRQLNWYTFLDQPFAKFTMTKLSSKSFIGEPQNLGDLSLGDLKEIPRLLPHWAFSLLLQQHAFFVSQLSPNPLGTTYSLGLKRKRRRKRKISELTRPKPCKLCHQPSYEIESHSRTLSLSLHFALSRNSIIGLHFRSSDELLFPWLVTLLDHHISAVFASYYIV